MGTKVEESKPIDLNRQFHAGEKLVANEANNLLRSCPVKVVFFAGSRNSGKTTFIARLGEMFRNGKFTGYRFAGSLTLCAIERATWHATVASGNTAPATGRTRRPENDTYIHLRLVRTGQTKPKLELLLSDLAGETFPTAVATQQFCSELDSLGRADALVLFLDCERLIDSVQRHSEVDNARTFLSQIVSVKHDKGLLAVDIVFSRWDFVGQATDAANQEKYCQVVEDDIKRRFQASFGSITFWRIAARPKGSSQPTNSKIQEMFAKWVDGSTLKNAAPSTRVVQCARDFSAFGLK